jgi:hypothetical protein
MVSSTTIFRPAQGPGQCRLTHGGSFEALFAGHFRKLLADLHFRQRTMFELEHSFLPAWGPLARTGRWLGPARLP